MTPGGLFEAGPWTMFLHPTATSAALAVLLVAILAVTLLGARGGGSDLPAKLGLVALLVAATIPATRFVSALRAFTGLSELEPTPPDFLAPILRWSGALVVAAAVCGVGFVASWWLADRAERGARGKSGGGGAALLVIVVGGLLTACAPDDLPWRGHGGTDEARLAAAIRSEDPWVKTLAVSDARPRRIRPGAAIPALREALADDDPRIRAGVLDALGRFGPDASPAVADVAEALTDVDPVVRRLAAWALGEIGRAARGAPLEALERLQTDDPDPGVRGVATRAIGRLACEGHFVLHPKPRVAVDRASHEQIELGVLADGSVVWRQHEYDFDALRGLLARRADSRRDDEPPWFSKVSLSVDLHRDVPWAMVRTMLAACAHPDVRIAHVGFGSRFAWTRPEDQIQYQPVDPASSVEPLPEAIPVDVTVRIAYDAPPATSAELAARIAALHSRAPEAGIGLIVDPAVPCIEVFEILDLLREAGFHRVRDIDEGEAVADDPKSLVKMLRPGPARRAGVVIR